MNFAQCFRDAYDDENVRIEFSSYTFVVTAIHKSPNCLDCNPACIRALWFAKKILVS